jgi:hypothetical protein
MKIQLQPPRLREQPLSRRRPPSFRALNDLIARRRQLRQRIGVALALCLPIGWLLLNVD